MTDNDALSQVLREWHEWGQSYSPARGYPSKAAGCSFWRPSRQHDSENGASETDHHAGTMEIVDFEVSEMPEIYRIAIHVTAQALAIGVSVFRNPRLPANDVERLRVISEARGALHRRLTRRGVLELAS